MMDQFDEELRKRAREEPFPIPEDYHGRVFAACAGLQEEPRKKKLRWPGWIAAAVAIMIALPNLSPAAAAAMAEIPVLGVLVEIVTFRDYSYDDGHSSAEVLVPELGGSAAAEQVSRDIEAYTDQILEQFQADCETVGKGHQGLDVDSQVVTDTEQWFTLRLDVVETRASGYQYSRFYNIDKRTGEIVTLGDVFAPGSDWNTILTAEVHRQMDLELEGYFPEKLEQLEDDQSFYWDDERNLVLVFDEYAIAAGYVGMPEFVIAPEVFAPLLKLQ